MVLFFIKVKELTGCMSVGDTLDEAYSMIKDAMESWLSVAIDEDDFIPEPEIWAQKKYSGKFVVRTPTYLHKELSEKAEENGVSLNTYAVSLLSRRCGIIETKDNIISSLSEIIIGEEKDYKNSGVTSYKKEVPVPNVIHATSIFKRPCEDIREN